MKLENLKGNTEVINQEATTGSEQLLNDGIKGIKIYYNDSLIACIQRNDIKTLSEVTIQIDRS